ncbi:MAG TPA: RNA polymerase sigma factor [Steroidobacteraceae bacterium]|jgi:RNA polymerase sigma-70 factor (ECF subfamily)|nr:RNA polymerase sigma factor [Steroidobacteraceae bacterium]
MVSAAQNESIEWEPALVQRAAGGDVRAFERLYRHHVGSVYGLCLRLTRDAVGAEDCAQEAFLNAWRALKRFETRSSFGTWLHRIAVNVVLSRRRKVAAQPELPPLPAGGEEDGEHARAAGEWALDTPVEEREIEAAVAALPDGARDALVLCGIYGYSHPEAARMLGLAEGTCKAQLHRARALLRARLEMEGHRS